MNAWRAEDHDCLYCFFLFHKPIRSRLVRGHEPTSQPIKAPTATLRLVKPGYTRFSKSFIKYQQIAYTFYFINAILNYRRWLKVKRIVSKKERPR